jgi:nucleoside-diphosphate-sugar epimerase
LPADFFHNDRIECYDNQEWREGKLPWNKIDMIVHCAFARSSNGRLLAESLEFTKALFSEAVENRVSAIINISSQSVYGRSQSPFGLKTLRFLRNRQIHFMLLQNMQVNCWL